MKSLIKLTALLLVVIIVATGCGPVNEESSDTNVTSTDKQDIQQTVCDHYDKNDDGSCDLCFVSLIVVVDFYAINDLHGKFADSDTNPGVDELTTYFKNAYETDENVVLLSSGDMWQGSSESNLTKGMIITEWMNSLDFVAMTIGNHEYDWGHEYIDANLDIANFGFLAINIFDVNTNDLVEYATPSVMVDIGKMQIGIIGAIGDCYSSISGDKSTEIYFETGDELTELVKQESVRLRDQGADFIVYSIHDGYEFNSDSTKNVTSNEIRSYYDTELSEGYVDLVFEGHTHKRYILKDEQGVYHLQGGGENSGISHVEIMYNFITNTVHVNLVELVKSNTYSSLSDDSLINELLKKYEDEISISSEIIGNNSSYRSSKAIKQKVADLYYQFGNEIWGDEYDIYLGGGFISTRNPYDLDPGEIKYSHLQSLLPFDNKLVLCSIKGYDLKKRFIETSNDNYFICLGDNNKSIDINATYYVVVDKYTSTYAPNKLTEISEYSEEIYARDLLAEYIKNGGWTSP